MGFGALSQSFELAARSGIFNLTLLATILPLAGLSFGLRIIRWHVLARQLVPGLPVRVSAYTHAVGFAFSATPGRVAELYKLKLLQQATSVPAVTSLPAVVVEHLTDVIAFGVMVVIGSMLTWSDVLETNRLIDVAIAGIGIVGLVGLSAIVRWQRRDRDALPRLFRRIGTRLFAGRSSPPGGGQILKLLAQVQTGGSLVMTPTAMTIAILCVLVGRTADSLVLWTIADAAGIHLSIPLAILMIGTAGFVGGISLSPGGLGAAEATMVGIALTQGASVAAALLTALSTRAFIFWLWIALGLSILVVQYGRKWLWRTSSAPSSKHPSTMARLPKPAVVAVTHQHADRRR